MSAKSCRAAIGNGEFLAAVPTSVAFRFVQPPTVASRRSRPFNEGADNVLILDTANDKYPRAWVPVDEFRAARAAPAEAGSKTTRGYIVVSMKAKAGG
jgi:hypothetical protein